MDNPYHNEFIETFKELFKYIDGILLIEILMFFEILQEISFTEFLNQVEIARGGSNLLEWDYMRRLDSI